MGSEKSISIIKKIEEKDGAFKSATRQKKHVWQT